MTLSEIYRAIEAHLNDSAIGMPWEDELMEALKHMDNAVGMEFRFDVLQLVQDLKEHDLILASDLRRGE